MANFSGDGEPKSGASTANQSLHEKFSELFAGEASKEKNVHPSDGANSLVPHEKSTNVQSLSTTLFTSSAISARMCGWVKKASTPGPARKRFKTA